MKSVIRLAIVGAIALGSAEALKIPRRLNQLTCTGGQMATTTFGSFTSAAQSQTGAGSWFSKSAFELTHNTKTTGYGHIGQYSDNKCTLKSTTCGSGYTHANYGIGAKSPAGNAACTKCPFGKWVRRKCSVCRSCSG